MRVMDVVAAALKAEGVEFITGFPFNQVFDSCAELGIRPIMARTERVAINIADGFSRMSGGRAFGVAGVQYGPGAEASFGAVAQAWSDGVPLLVLAGGQRRAHAGGPARRRGGAPVRAGGRGVLRRRRAGLVGRRAAPAAGGRLRQPRRGRA